ncbi:hypothetical protein ILYODFUR_002487 [Ilyodon furcidens]|uniref:Uncharacterized protein n=1 Tax=Ilyodon furcidens TaxID=33524 RepID=A0ABV0SXB7_9TELE
MATCLSHNKKLFVLSHFLSFATTAFLIILPLSLCPSHQTFFFCKFSQDAQCPCMGECLQDVICVSPGPWSLSGVGSGGILERDGGGISKGGVTRDRHRKRVREREREGEREGINISQGSWCSQAQLDSWITGLQPTGIISQKAPANSLDF